MVVPPLVTPATTTVMGVGMAAQGLWGSAGPGRQVGRTVDGKSVESIRSVKSSDQRGKADKGRAGKKDARTEGEAMTSTPAPVSARSPVASLATSPVLMPLSQSHSGIQSMMRRPHVPAQSQTQARPLPNLAHAQTPHAAALELDDLAPKMPEYEPVLAALEAAGVVVVSVHPAFMDVLIREVAGVYHT